MKITFSQIKKIAQKIAQKYKPEKIILFGSFAWGKPKKDSDVDFLIIKNTRKNFLKRQMEVRRIIKGEIPVDILVHTPKEIERRLKLGDFFYKKIIKKGRCLYEKPK